MTLRKLILLCMIGVLMLAFEPAKAQTQFSQDDFDTDSTSPGHFKALECAAIDVANVLVTPLPIVDPKTDRDTLMTASESITNNFEALLQLIKYIEKMRKLSLNPFSLMQDIDITKVTPIKNVTSGAQTIVDGFKGNMPKIPSDLEGFVMANFEKHESTEDAIEKIAVTANPVGSVEKIVVQERRDAFIQQAIIDLHADILVAKKKLADLKESDSEAQDSSSTGDTIGTLNMSIQMKNYENQVQALEQNLKTMRITLEGIKNLRSASMITESADSETENAGIEYPEEDEEDEDDKIFNAGERK